MNGRAQYPCLPSLPLAVEDGVCRLRYTGPPPIGMGVKAAVKDKFPDIKEVVFVED